MIFGDIPMQYSEAQAVSISISKSLKAYLVLNFICIIGLCVASITAVKIVTVYGVSFACCNFYFALLTFPITDVISEVWGIKAAKKTVYISSIAQLIFVLLIQSSFLFPGALNWSKQEAYTTILGIGPKVVLANMVAFFASQMWDVYVYAKMKRLCKGRYLWIRNNLSTMTSQLINAILFMNIVFYGQGYDIVSLILGSLILRWVLALIDTPLVYILVNYIHAYLDKKTIAYTVHQ